MATHTLSSPLILDDDDAPQAVARSRKLSFMHRFYIALLIAQQRRARRQIDRVLGAGLRAARGQRGFGFGGHRFNQHGSSALPS